MKKFLLLTAIAAGFQVLNAQATQATQGQNAPKTPIGISHIHQQLARPERPATHTQGTNPARKAQANARGSQNSNNAKSLADGTPLNSLQIGSSGNLLGITDFACNQLYCYGPLNLVSFVHRANSVYNPTADIAQYSYDFSTNSGASWTSNIGPITVGPVDGDPINNNGTNPHGRYPLGAIYNPAGNLDPTGAYEVYSGTWHNEPPTGSASGSWVGQMYGSGPITGPATSYNVNVDTINGGTTAVATGFCQSVPGTFWAVNENYTADFANTTDEITRGIWVEKGVWNSNTSMVDWTATQIVQPFDSFSESGTMVSAALSFDIAFDPSGQYGWISVVGDVENTADSVLEPIFWSSTDSGHTWNGPTQIPLDSLPGVITNLSPATHYATTNGGTPGLLTSGIATLESEAKLAVDYNGNPHLLCTVGNGGSYEIEEGAGYIMYDITLNPNGCTQTWNGWGAVFVDSVATLEGNTTADATALTEDNRPLISRTPDGTKMFFFWSASDAVEEGVIAQLSQGEGEDNNANPNLFVRGFDLQHATSTPTVNLTQGDPLWGGPTVDFPNPGSIQGSTASGAFYSTVSPIAQISNNGYTVPLVLTQIDTTGSDLSTNPADFWYIDNINFAPFNFTISNTAQVNITGADTVYLPIGHLYVDSGATVQYIDTACTHSGNLHIVTDIPTVLQGIYDTVPGVYVVGYLAEDASNDVYASASRVVIVVSAPIANFTYSDAPDTDVQFFDASQYNPTYWAWDFGDGTTDNGTDPNPLHQYHSAPATFYVCLTDSNAWGVSHTYCDSVVVSGTVGIRQIDFASNINMFPNPTSGEVSLTLSGVTQNFTVAVYNVLGEEVIPVNQYSAGTTNVSVNANQLSDGIYLVKIQSTQGSAVKRLTVSHK